MNSLLKEKNKTRKQNLNELQYESEVNITFYIQMF
jgi:hypothetical protein